MGGCLNRLSDNLYFVDVIISPIISDFHTGFKNPYGMCHGSFAQLEVLSRSEEGQVQVKK